MPRDVNEAIRAVAKMYQSSEQEVLQNIQDFINESYASNDPAVRAMWSDLPFRSCPSATEFITYIAVHISKEEQHILH